MPGFAQDLVEAGDKIVIIILFTLTEEIGLLAPPTNMISIIPYHNHTFQHPGTSPPQAFGVTAAPVSAPPPTLFFRTNLNPATSIIKPSTPNITANVTIAPITPATALLIPPLPPLPLPLPPTMGPGLLSGLAQTPVEFPHASHHWL